MLFLPVYNPLTSVPIEVKSNKPKRKHKQIPKYCKRCGKELIKAEPKAYDEMTGKPIDRWICPEIERLLSLKTSGNWKFMWDMEISAALEAKTHTDTGR